MNAPPSAAPYGGPPPQMGAPGGAPMGAPQAYGGDPFAPPQQDLPGGMDDLARRLPQSKPGTLFGVPLSTLRDVGLQRKALFLLGIALVASIFVPLQLSPFTFVFKGNMFKGLVWPAIAGGAYLLVAAAPPNIRSQVPPIVMEWLPFGISFSGVQIVGLGGFPGFLENNVLYSIGMATLIFGLLARLANPNDQIARIIIAVGAGCLLIPFIDAFNLFDVPGVLFKVYAILFLAVMVVGMACILYVVPPKKLPPALQAVDAFAPHVTALLLVWLVAQIVLLILAIIVHGHGVKVLDVVLFLARSLLMLLAYFGVLMLTAPAAYDSIMNMVKGNKPPPQGGGYPPQGGGYPPQGGGYPPQGGGYPPQGGGGGWPQQ